MLSRPENSCKQFAHKVNLVNFQKYQNSIAFAKGLKTSVNAEARSLSSDFLPEDAISAQNVNSSVGVKIPEKKTTNTPIYLPGTCKVVEQT